MCVLLDLIPVPIHSTTHAAVIRCRNRTRPFRTLLWRPVYDCLLLSYSTRSAGYRNWRGRTLVSQTPSHISRGRALLILIAHPDHPSASVELFTESFINHLFELVERTRLLSDETLNYALIKLIVCSSVLAPSAMHNFRTEYCVYVIRI